MSYEELTKRVHDLYGPVLVLRRVLPPGLRLRIEELLTLGVLVLGALVLILSAFSMSALGERLPLFALLGDWAQRAWGLFLIVFAVRFIFSAIEAFHRSYYFRGLETLLTEQFTEGEAGATSFEVATIVDGTSTNDITGGFLDSVLGQEILFRAGVTEEAYNSWYDARTPELHGSAFFLESEPGVLLTTYTRSIYKQDKSFAHFLSAQQITGKDLEGAAGWVMRTERKARKKARWYSRDNLGRIPGLGKNFSYGETYLIEKYGHDMKSDPVYKSAGQTVKEESDEVEALESVLAKGRQANALLIGEEGAGKRERVAQLMHKIERGEAVPQLEDKQIFLLSIESILTVKKEKAAFEEELGRVLAQAARAGNVILYLESMPSALQSTATVGADLVDLLRDTMESESVHLILSSDPDGFHRSLSRDARLMQFVETVHMHSIDYSGMIEVLEERAAKIERTTHVAFTYPALKHVATLADRYFPDGVMPDKALDLLEEVAPDIAAHGRDVVYPADVESLVSRKTHVPLGTPDAAEKEELLHLEDTLHKRVVGQEEAVDAVAKALRRARAGVESTDRPMGSFLFLGPTGVGKTETAKALAVALFNDEEAMIRFDMSEYQGPDALDRLIGNFDSGRPGRLSTMLREKQFGVLLLDEFEKSDRNVHDLFLQVLDEGQFSDANGKKVNARNLIIIATSNAGADLIWKWFKEGKKIVEQKRALVDELIDRGAYRPEFLNRFDDIILFHPLTDAHVRSIAHIQLNALKKRLEEKGITLEITEELLDTVARAGYDPQFGGRPMRRTIKEKVEQAVADRLLTGTLKPGDSLTLTKADLG